MSKGAVKGAQTGVTETNTSSKVSGGAAKQIKGPAYGGKNNA